MKVCFYPLKSKTNDYINNTINLLRELNIKLYLLENVKKDFFLFKSIDVFHFNWYENLSPNNYFNAFKDLLKKVIFINMLKLFNKKIVWTMHNKISHESLNDKLSIFMIKFMAEKSDKIIIHCNESKEILSNICNDEIVNKTYYIPHVNYIDNIHNDNKITRNTFNIDDEELVFLFIGAIRKYKNIELLIDVFNELKLNNCKLIIAGNPINEEYKKDLIRLINTSKNIIHILRFLDNSELYDLINLSNIVVLPYDKKSTLNSGSIILSFSCKKTVISPMIGTLKDMREEKFYYGYDYHNDTEHYQMLKENIIKVYNDYKINNYILKEKGEQAYLYVKKYHSPDIIKKKLNYLYYNCLSIK